LVNQKLLLQDEHLAPKNRILNSRLQPGWRLSDGERAALTEIGRRLGRKGLLPVAHMAKGICRKWVLTDRAAHQVGRRAYAAIPKVCSMKRTCPTTSPFANHLTWPFRIMFAAS
jgi:hypothetical protein